MRRICIALLCLLAGTMALAQPNFLTFHGDRQRTGWISTETTLTPANVSGGNFGSLWNSQPFDTEVLH